MSRFRYIRNKLPFYDFFRWNSISQFILDLINSDAKKERNKDKVFYNDLFSLEKLSNLLIFDIGANRGTKVEIFKDFASKIVAFEPDDYAFKTLKYRFGNDRVIELVKLAVADKEETLELNTFGQRNAYNTLSKKWTESIINNNKDTLDQVKKVESTTLKNTISRYGKPDYIKIDVEGFEKEVLSTLDIPISLISFEVNLPEFKSETIEIINHLSAITKDTHYFVRTTYGDDKIEWLDKEFVLKYLSSTYESVFEIFTKMK